VTYERPSDEELEDIFLQDCADSAMAESLSMATMCAECPGRAGTDASNTKTTTDNLSACKRRRFPFWCHMTRKGEFCTHLCASWTASDIAGHATLERSK
jgi:hypothetical protein